MKVCLLISGHLRTFRECLPTQRKMLIDKLGCDVFMHSWTDIESKTNSWHSSHMPNRTVEDSDVSFIESIVSPKSLVIEEQVDFGIDKNLFGSQISLNGLKNMTLGFKRTYEMMKDYENKTGIKYDLIIKIRPDIMLKRPFEKDFLSMKDNFILFFGNPCPIENHDGEKRFYHNFRALDILSVCTNDAAANGVYGLFDNFEDYYGKKSWHHSPYLDLVIDKNIPFNICLRYLYDSAWEIKRDRR